MAKLISKTYGEALFELAVEENKTDEYMEEILVVLDVLKDNPEFSAMMKHPKILKEEKQKVIQTVFGGRLSDELTGFICLIVAKDRYGKIQEIMQYFLDQVKELKGIGVAYVTSSLELSAQQKKDVESRLLETTSFKEMEMHFGVDATLIGGLIIRIGDRVVDSSIKSKLAELERTLMKIQLHAHTGEAAYE